MDKKIKPFLDLGIILLLFVASSYIISSNIEFIKGIIGEDYKGMIFYLILAIVSEIIIPISALPMMPLASNLYGGFIAAILSIIGWTIGGIIAFMLARIYGVSVIEKIVSMEKIRKFEEKIPQENIFWSIVLLRLVIPVDVLSYALGIFSRIKLKDYILATFIGLTPFAFAFAYLGEMPFQ